MCVDILLLIKNQLHQHQTELMVELILAKFSYLLRIIPQYYFQ